MNISSANKSAGKLFLVHHLNVIISRDCLSTSEFKIRQRVKLLISDAPLTSDQWLGSEGWCFLCSMKMSLMWTWAPAELDNVIVKAAFSLISCFNKSLSAPALISTLHLCSRKKLKIFLLMSSLSWRLWESPVCYYYCFLRFCCKETCHLAFVHNQWHCIYTDGTGGAVCLLQLLPFIGVVPSSIDAYHT